MFLIGMLLVMGWTILFMIYNSIKQLSIKSFAFFYVSFHNGNSRLL